MALPTAVFAMVASMGLAGAALMASVDAQRGSARDQDSKAAIAAADAGADMALLRLNRFRTSVGSSDPCLGPAGEEVAEVSTGWCAATSPESVGDATYSYQTTAYTPGSALSVVSVGTAGGVSRRIEVGFISYNGDEVFADERFIGQDGIELDGTADVFADIGTNGDIVSNDNSTLCGDVRHGKGQSSDDPDCDGTVSEGDKNLPPFILPAGVETKNSNCRLELTCPNKTEVDTYSKNRTKTNPWDPETRTINVSSNATLTMGGADYFVCGLFVDNGQVIMAGGSGIEVRIFFDTPENCGLEDGDPQIVITGNANLVSTGYNPEKGMFNVPGLYVQGSPNISTTIDLSGNSGTNELMLYAPYSDIEIGGGATWIGMLAGKTIDMHGNPIFESHPGIDPPDIFYSSLWEPTRYIECTGPTASPPNASC